MVALRVERKKVIFLNAEVRSREEEALRALHTEELGAHNI